jgi:hypothetical protein
MKVQVFFVWTKEDVPLNTIDLIEKLVFKNKIPLSLSHLYEIFEVTTETNGAKRRSQNTATKLFHGFEYSLEIRPIMITWNKNDDDCYSKRTLAHACYLAKLPPKIDVNELFISETPDGGPIESGNVKHGENYWLRIC